MTLMPAVLEFPVPSNLETYEQAASFKANLVWKKLDEISVEEAISYWLPTLSPKTQLSYAFKNHFKGICRLQTN